MKMPVKKGQIKTEFKQCYGCDGTGYNKVGDCDRGCCAPFIKKLCYSCKGSRTIKIKYKAVLIWKEI